MMSHAHPAKVLGIDAGAAMIDAFFVGAHRESRGGKRQATPHDESVGLLADSPDAPEQRGRSVEEVVSDRLTVAYPGTAMPQRVVPRKAPRAAWIVPCGAEAFHRLGQAVLTVAAGALAVAVVALLPAVWVGGLAAAMLVTLLGATVTARYKDSSREMPATADALSAMRQRLENERRECSRRVLAAQEAERLRIARELHDEIGQTLTAVALRAEHRARQTRDPDPEFAELAAIAQQSLADVRRISLELRLGALDELGLINALISLCVRVENESAVRVRRYLEGSIPDVPPDVELALYRIAQEALTNVMRHAEASEVDVVLICADGQLVLSVSDNGRGLMRDVRAGGGLAGMRERAMLIGADLDVRSTAIGLGVTLRVPFTSPNTCPRPLPTTAPSCAAA